MVDVIMVNGLSIKKIDMEEEYIFMIMIQNILVNGLMINQMVKENISKINRISTKGHFTKENTTDMEN